MNLPQRVLLTTGAQIAGKVALAAAAIVSLRLTTGYLGLDGFGQLAIVLAFVPLIAVVSDLGIPLVLGRELARDPTRVDELGGTMLAARVISAFAVFGLFLMAVPFLPYENEVKVALAIAAFGVALGAISGLPAVFFQLHVRLDLSAIVDFVTALASVGLLYGVIRLDLGFVAVAATLPLAAGVSCITAFALARRFWRPRFRAGWTTAAPLLRAALPLGLVTVLGLLHFKVDSLMLSVMRPASDVGIYAVSYRFLEQALILPVLLLAAVFPILVRSVHDRSPDAEEILRRAVKLLLLIGVPVAIALVALAGPLVRLFAGEGFAAAERPLRILAPALVFAFVNAPFATLLIALDRRKALVGASLAGLALNIGMNLWAIPAYGYNGAAVTTVISEAFGFALIFFFARRAYPFSLGGGSLLRIAPAAGVMALIFGVFALTGFTAWFALVPAALAFAAVAYAAKAVTHGDVRLVLGR